MSRQTQRLINNTAKRIGILAIADTNFDTKYIKGLGNNIKATVLFSFTMWP